MSYESVTGTIGHISIDEKTTGTRSAGKLHTAFDEAGTGNGRFNVPRQSSTLPVGEVCLIQHNSLRCRCFTLMELLIVIAIIAILASMLLPALGKARDKAQAILCIGNIKQVSLGAIEYANDYTGFFPCGKQVANGLFSNTNGGQGQGQMGRYIGVGLNQSFPAKVVICPKGTRVGHNPEWQTDFSYAFNGGDGGFASDTLTDNIVKTEKVFNPSSRALLGEIGYDGWMKQFPAVPAYWGYGGSFTYRPFIAFRHQQLTNVLFVDGHSSAVKYNDVPLNTTKAYDSGSFFRDNR